MAFRGERTCASSSVRLTLRKKKEHSTGINVPEDQHIPVALTFEEQTEVTRKARRVDVVVRKK